MKKNTKRKITKRTTCLTLLGLMISCVMVGFILFIRYAGNKMYEDGIWGDWDRSFGLTDASIYFLEFGEDLVFAGAADSGVYAKDLDSEKWEYYRKDLRDNFFDDLYSFKYDASSNSIYLINNSGFYYLFVPDGNWNYVNHDDFYADLEASITSFIWEGNHIILVSFDNALYRSVNDVENWVKIPFESETEVKKIYSLPSQPNILLILTENAIYRSADGGLNWDETFSSNNDSFDLSIEEMVDPTSLIIVIRNENLLLSRNYGESWENIDTLHEVGSIQDFAIAGKLKKHIIFMRRSFKNDHLITKLYRAELENLENIDQLEQISEIDCVGAVIKVNPKNLEELYVGTNCGVAVSKDTGETWEWLNDGISDSFNITSITSAKDILYATSLGRPLIISTDQGKSWSSLPSLRNRLRAKFTTSVVVNPSNNCQILVASFSYLWRSTDCGNNWTFLEGPEDMNFLIGTPTSVIGIGYSGLYLTENFGLSWEPLLLLEGSSSFLFSVDPTTPGLFYMYEDKYEESVGELFVSADAGKSWDLIVNDDSLNGGISSIAVTTDGTGDLLIGAGGKLYQYYAQSKKLDQITNQNFSYIRKIIQGKKQSNFLYLCTSEGIFSSDDFGKNWFHLYPNTIDCQNLYLTPNETALLLTDWESNHLYRLEFWPKWRLALKLLPYIIKNETMYWLD